MGKRKRIDGYSIPVSRSGPAKDQAAGPGLFSAWRLLLLVVVAAAAAWLFFKVVRAQPASLTAPATIDLHLRVTDGQGPVAAMVRLEWADTGGEFEVGPVADVVLPIPADGAAVTVTVSAPGYLAWSEVMSPTVSFDLVVRLIGE